MSARLVDPGATPWEAGRFDGRTGPQRLLFGRMFEDPSIELELMPRDGRVLCIASAGDTARALAAAGRHVLAVDINSAQVAEVRRRIDGGRPRRGAADRLLAAGRAALVPLGWHRGRLVRFCALGDLDEQAAEWRGLLGRHVRPLIETVLSARVLRLAYGSEFARAVPAGFAGGLLDRMGGRIASAPNRENPWLAHLLTGTWSAPDPTTGGDRIDLVGADVVAVLESLPAASLDGITLSNILDGPGPSYAERLLGAAHRVARPGAPIVIRSFLDAADPDARARADRDRSLLWGSIVVHRP